MITLQDLHQRFSKDPSYRQAHAELSETVPFVISCMKAREEMRLSRKNLAALAGVSLNTITRFERYDIRDRETLFRIFDALYQLHQQGGTLSDRHNERANMILASSRLAADRMRAHSPHLAPK